MHSIDIDIPDALLQQSPLELPRVQGVCQLTPAVPLHRADEPQQGRVDVLPQRVEIDALGEPVGLGASDDDAGLGAIDEQRQQCLDEGEMAQVVGLEVVLPSLRAGGRRGVEGDGRVRDDDVEALPREPVRAHRRRRHRGQVQLERVQLAVGNVGTRLLELRDRGRDVAPSGQVDGAPLAREKVHRFEAEPAFGTDPSRIRRMSHM